MRFNNELHKMLPNYFIKKATKIKQLSNSLENEFKLEGVVFFYDISKTAHVSLKLNVAVVCIECLQNERRSASKRRTEFNTFIHNIKL